MRGRVLVYSIVGCPHCLRAKNTLAQQGIQYTDVSLDNYQPQVREELKRHTKGRTTVPQIFFNEVHVGGNEELQKLINDNKDEWKRLVELVERTAAPDDGPQPPDDNQLASDAKHLSGREFICEPDEYARLVAQMKAAGLVDGHTGWFGGRPSFKGSRLVDWLCTTKEISEEHAKDIGQHLIDKHFGKPTSGHSETFDVNSHYRLLEDDDTTALNAGPLSDCKPLPAGELGETMRLLILGLYAKHISADGMQVDYAAIKSDADFESYVRLTKELRRVDVLSCDRAHKLAFFINVYNALVIHATAVRGAPANTWQRWKFFNTVRYVMGGESYSLQQMENGVLRANRKGVGMLTRPFGKHDPRLKVALEQPESMIHFALNCGAKSCPPIKTFSAKGIAAELKVATEAFLETDDAVRLDTLHNTLHASQIFKWYREDFGGSDAKVVEWIAAHLGEGERRAALQKALAAGQLHVKYMPYDWGHNAK